MNKLYKIEIKMSPSAIERRFARFRDLKCHLTTVDSDVMKTVTCSRVHYVNMERSMRF